MPQISNPMTSYIMLMDYTLCPQSLVLFSFYAVIPYYRTLPLVYKACPCSSECSLSSIGIQYLKVPVWHYIVCPAMQHPFTLSSFLSLAFTSLGSSSLSLVSLPLLTLWQVIEHNFVSNIDIDFIINPGKSQTSS